MKKLKYILFGGDPNYDYYEEDIYSMGLISTIGMMIIALSLMILPMLFTSCTRTVYVDRNTNEVVEVRKVKSIDFIKLQRLDYDADYPFIYVDTYTDVLYAVYPHKMSAIMKADGTCMTYQEFLERNK